MTTVRVTVDATALAYGVLDLTGELYVIDGVK